jgi:broad specificity phosphatase PhoE
MSRLILVRHGVTAWNQAGRYQGHRDVPLGEDGRWQTQQVAARLAAEPIDICLTSDLSRARDTAAAIMMGRELALRELPALRELAFGRWEGIPTGDIAVQHPEAWQAWIRDPVTARPPEGETLQELLDRCVTALGEVLELPSRRHEPHDWFSYAAARGQGGGEPRRSVLVVSHGGPIRVLLAHLLGVPLRAYWQFAIRPASVSILDLYPEGAIAEVIGETAHLRDPVPRAVAPETARDPAAPAG